jgi:hypothetical protein
MILKVLTSLWNAYDNLGVIKRFFVLIGFLKQYYFMWWQNPRVSIRLTKIFILKNNPKKIIPKIYDDLIKNNDKIKPQNGISNINNKISFKPEFSKITLEINANSGISPDENKNLVLETGDFIIYPFRNNENLFASKEDFLKVSDLILNNVKSERINEIIHLEIIFEKLIKSKAITFLHENCDISCNKNKIQINNCTGKEYEPLIKAIILRWYKELF